jgi:phosphoketolase
VFSRADAERLFADGAIRVAGAGLGAQPEVILTAIGGYQLEHVLRAAARLAERGVPHSVVYMLEPGRFRDPRDEYERRHMASAEVTQSLFPGAVAARVFNVHTRVEPMRGVLWPLVLDPRKTRFLGFRNQGATVDVEGLLYLNEATWAHVLREVALATGRSVGDLLTPAEVAAIERRASPHGVVIKARRPVPEQG